MNIEIEIKYIYIYFFFFKRRKIKDILSLSHVEWKNFTCLYLATSGCWPLPCKLRSGAFWIRRRVTGRFWTSCLHTSHILLPLMLNHFIAHSLWAKASSPLQLHSILRVSAPSPSSTRQILQTASSSGISLTSSSFPSEPQD